MSRPLTQDLSDKFMVATSTSRIGLTSLTRQKLKHLLFQDISNLHIILYSRSISVNPVFLVSPTNYRTNADLSELITVKNKTLNSFTIPANGYSEKTLNISESGYIPMIASVHNIGSGKVTIPKMDISGNTLTLEFDNLDASNSKTIEPSFYVLYKKA